MRTFAARVLAWSCFGVLAFSFTAVHAQSNSFDLDPTKIDVHGFVSQGFILSTKNNYLALSKRGSPEFTEVGLNFTKAFSDDIRVGAQLFARDLGPQGNYEPQFDWFYLDYRFRDWLGFRAGRTKIPFGLYNEQNDIDVARVPVLLPKSVYDVQNRQFLLAQTGAELYGNLQLAAAGELEYRIYAGTVYTDTSSAEPNALLSITRFDVPYVYGARLMWLTPVPGLQAGFSGQILRFDADFLFAPALSAALGLPPELNGKVLTQLSLKLWLASIEYVAYNWQLAAEYGRWAGDYDSPVPALFPPHTVNERYYVLAAYHFTTWFTPGVYYAGLYGNVDQREGKESYQHDFSATLRFDVTDHWLIKLEGHFMHGTYGLLDSRGLNDGRELKELTKNWTVLLLKTTGYF